MESAATSISQFVSNGAATRCFVDTAELFRSFPESDNCAQLTSEDLKGFVSVLMELQAYDNELVALFQEPPDADSVNLNALVEFRGKVARSINRYSMLVKKCWSLSEMLPHGTIRDEAKIEYQKHSAKLQDCKSRLSVWWSNTERRFHMMRMASLVSEVEMTRHATELNEKKVCLNKNTKNELNKNEKKVNFVEDLKETKLMMHDELMKMDAATIQLEQSSKIIETADQVYQDYGLKLSTASALFTKLMKRAEADSLYIWYSFLFLLFVCGFVLLRRIGIIKCVLSLCAIIINSAIWLIEYFYENFFVYFFASKNVENFVLNSLSAAN